MLDRFYGNVAVNNLPDLSKTDLEKFPFCGGIVHIADTDSTKNNGWIVLYRSFYGGERDRGRHGTVLLTAWIRANETFEELLPVFTNDTFKFVEQHRKERPVPAPAALTEEIGGNLPEKWQKGLEKFAPYITPRFDSHLKITDNPTGLNYEQSPAFVKDRAEWEAEHVEKNKALGGQVSILREQVASLQKANESIKELLTARTAERDKWQSKCYGSNNGLMSTYIQCSTIVFVITFILMFIISYAAPNWSVSTIKTINPFSSATAKPTLEQQLAEVDRMLENFDERKTQEKERLETRKRELEAEKQREEQKKEGT